ncbi:GNAT family N-acetyltransferase [Hymenobacter psoromatis]|uniref:GNAT family N-acetyltransferase n=1 Tax=Hymenobacter psoromatis TaxID=1484116 RepID=UPI001CBCF280|nr:GNAT family N-acetyltransferase [Hymenobacter psoromatis]
MSIAQPRIPGDVLDYYLSLGYYRMYQDLFTCQFLPVGTRLYTVHWLRLALARVQPGPKQRRLRRLNERFAVMVKPFQLTAEYEGLYARYHQALDFDAAPSLEALLLDGAAYSVFDTRVVEVRAEGQLLAAGIFDHGTRSIAGIVNFYDPNYHKYSLGKYLMLCKLDYAHRQQLAYYYPGYLVQGYPKFDYKLFAGPEATEIFDDLNSQWLPFSWEEVARQSAALLTGGLPELGPGQGGRE